MKNGDNGRIGAAAGGADRPSAEQIGALLRRVQRRREIFRSIGNILGVLVVIAAAVTLVFSLWLPALQVQRGSMAPTLNDGEVVVFITTGAVGRGDIVAFHNGNQILVKRVVAVAGDVVDIGGDGAVLLNGARLDEPYVSELSAGERTTELPCKVPDNQFFVLGDHRQTSIDSRNADIGTVRQDQIIGKALLRIWPLNAVGLIN